MNSCTDLDGFSQKYFGLLMKINRGRSHFCGRYNGDFNDGTDRKLFYMIEL